MDITRSSPAGATDPILRMPAPGSILPGPQSGIQPLAEADRPAVEAHFLRLSREDRALRFGSPTNDALIARYADSMSLDGSLGLFLDSEIVGVAHLPQLSADEVELGLSIEPRSRSCGWGHRLLSASLESTHANGNKGLTAHYASANRPMAQLMRAVPRQAQQSGPDVCARIDLDSWAAEIGASNLPSGSETLEA